MTDGAMSGLGPVAAAYTEEEQWPVLAQSRQFALVASNVAYWRNHDLQNGRQQCLLSGSGNSHLNGRYAARKAVICGTGNEGRQRVQNRTLLTGLTTDLSARCPGS